MSKYYRVVVHTPHQVLEGADVPWTEGDWNDLQQLLATGTLSTLTLTAADGSIYIIPGPIVLQSLIHLQVWEEDADAV